MSVLIAGGGTGGHLFPGIAVAQEFLRRDPPSRVVFVGTSRGIEARAVPKAGFQLELLPVRGLRRLGALRLAGGIMRLPLALWKALRIVRTIRPDVAISVGGYAAGPAVLASWLCGVPCAVMEQNSIPGLTNKVLGRLAFRIFASLPTDSFDEAKVRVVGNPVRSDLLAIRDLPYRPQKPMRLLVFGGSQGARALNQVMKKLIPLLKGSDAKWQVVHQTGRSDFDSVRAAYEEADVDFVEVQPFIEDMASAYRDADLVVSRSGATTLAELTVCGRPSLLVPFPFAVDDHQRKNAESLVEAGAARCVLESDLDSDSLLEMLEHFAEHPEILEEMAARSKELGHPGAASEIVDSIIEHCAPKEKGESSFV